jgi:Na+-driven multidrug efflux pump
MKKVVDMTTGSPYRQILVFAIPLALSFMLQNLYAVGDVLIVSLSLGSVAATGVNLTASMVFLVLGFAQGVAAGFGIVLSQFVGAKDEKMMRKSVATSIVLSIIMSIVLSIAAVFSARPLLELLHTDAQYIEHSTQYIIAIFSGLIFTVAYNLTSFVLRAMGDSNTPLITLILCAALNLGLNSLLFIPAFPFGTAWAGWATVISQAISAIVGWVYIFTKFKVLRPRKEDFRLSWRLSWKHLAMGLPMALQYTITASGTMVQQRAFNVLPDPLYAMAQGAASKTDNIFGSLLNGCGASMATYCGQNYGAKRYDRLKSGFVASLVLGIGFSLVAAAGNVITCVPAAKLLLPGVEERVFDYVFRYIFVQSCFYYFLYLVFALRQSVQGVGRSALSVVGGVIEFAVRAVVAFTIAIWFGFDGACYSNALAWVGASAFFFVSYLMILRKLLKSPKNPETTP